MSLANSTRPTAIMTTAFTKKLVKEDRTTPFTPFDGGAGRVDAKKALTPGATVWEEARALPPDLAGRPMPDYYDPFMFFWEAVRDKITLPVEIDTSYDQRRAALHRSVPRLRRCRP